MCIRDSRLPALAAQRAAIDWGDEAGVAAIAAALNVEFFEADLLLDGVPIGDAIRSEAVSYTHLRAHETVLDLVCRLLLEKKKEK